MTGEVGEQRTVLDRAFFTLGETPETILNHAAESVLTWMRSNSKSRVTSAQLSEWLHDAVGNSVEQITEGARGLSKSAIDRLQAVAQEMGRSDMPEHDEVETLLRDMPRFELGTLPDDINMTAWMFLGSGFVRSRIISSLRQSVGADLKQALHLYGNALSQWSRQYVSRMVLMVSSHADAYRVQLQRIAGTSTEHIDVHQLEQDLAVLRNWTAKERSGEMLHHG